MDLGSSSFRSMLKLDALNTFFKAVAKDKLPVVRVNPKGFALTSDSGLIDTIDCRVEELSNCVHSYLSPEFCKALIGDASNSKRPMPGSIVALAGRTAMPCVCEAPPNALSSENGTKMVVEVS